MGQTYEDFELLFSSGNVKKAMADCDAKSRDLWQVPYGDIHIIPGYNVRERNQSYLDHVNNIADSILAEGFYQDEPLAGIIHSELGICITDGHSRYEGAGIAISKGAVIERLPMVIKPSSTNAVDLTVALVQSNSGKKLEPYELGVVCKRLVGYGWDTAQVADRFKLSKQYVDDLLMLLGADHRVRGMVTSEKISASTAIETLKKHGIKSFDVLNGAVEKAVAAGKTKATAKDLPDAGFKKMLKKYGPLMFDILFELATNEGDGSSLSVDMTKRVEELLYCIGPKPEVAP